MFGFRRYMRLHLRLILSAQGSLEMNPVDNAGPCYPQDNIVGSHLCDELYEVNIANRLSQA